jgi:hypothetical protein
MDGQKPAGDFRRESVDIPRNQRLYTITDPGELANIGQFSRVRLRLLKETDSVVGPAGFEPATTPL